MRYFFLSALALFFCSVAYTQMEQGGKTLYGNEWIDYNADYLKIVVQQDGIYKLDYQTLVDAGFPANITGSALKLVNNGREQALFTSSEEVWLEGDYLMFYGEKNDGEIDRYHFKDWMTEQLNPRYSMYTDERVYYLSLSDSGQANLRYENQDNGLGGGLPEQEHFFMYREEQVYSEFNWSPSAPDVPDAFYSSFIKTEGFGTPMVSRHELSLNTANVYDTTVASRLEFRTGSNAQTTHIVHVNFNGDLLEVDQYSGNQVINYSYELETANLNTNNTLSLEGKGFSDLLSVAHAALVYPRDFDAMNQRDFEFSLGANKEERYFEVRRFNPGGRNFLFDLDNHIILEPELDNGTARFVIGNNSSGEARLILVAADAGLMSPKEIKQVRFKNVDQLNPEFLILTSEKLNNSTGGINPIDAYSAFRSSSAGGSYNTEVLNIEEIYDQFGYGIKQHAQSVRNFAQYVKTRWPDFKMVFLVGKALSYGNRNKNTNVESFVPTYGKPGSDNLMFSDPGLTYPYVGVGRLAARNKMDVTNYLDKARLHAQLLELNNLDIEERIHLKDIIHLSGGDPGIQQQLFNHLTDMKNILEGSDFGAAVTTYRKTSSDPVTTALSQQILNQINDGIAMLSFFGHSSASTFDFSVEDPADYENTGRLPVILSMGCRAGDIHETVFSLSENMILTKDRGAIGFVASSGSAFPTPLAVMGKDFYAKLGNEFYGMPLGLALRQVAEDLFDPVSTKVRTLYEQNTLHGDPAIELFNSEAPDYVVDFSSIDTGGDVGATDESIALSFDILNLGRGIEDSMTNLVIHEYGDAQKDSFYFRTAAPYNRSSQEIRLDNPGFAALGKNTIEIILDVNNEIAELPVSEGESNNSLKYAWSNDGYSFFVFDNSAFPVYPPEFGIVGDRNTSLIASSTNALGEAALFIMELDTTENFDSPFLVRSELQSSPAILEWQPGVDFQEGQVYYWRVSPGNEDKSIWNTSSFVFLEGKNSGWSQSHLYQWKKNQFETFDYDAGNRQFRFAENINEIFIKNGSYPRHEIQMTVQNNPAGYLPYLSDGEIPSGVYISSFDDVTGLPWINKPSPDGGLYDSELYTWWAQSFPNFPYRTDSPENRAKAIRFLDEIVPDGNYVILYTIQRNDFPGIGNYKPEEWAADSGINPDGKDLMSVLESYGAQRVRELESGARPYILVFKKNDPSFAVKELVADSPTEAVELDIEILGSWFEGNMSSVDLGPVKAWQQFEWATSKFNTQEDRIKLNIAGVREDDSEDILFEDIEDNELDLSSVSAAEYPKLKLYFHSSDSMARTSAQLDYWRVFYQELPEALIDVPGRFVFKSDTLYLGEKLEFGSRVRNVSQTDMDSLLIKYTIVDASNKERDVFTRVAPVAAQSELDIDFSYPTDDILGQNQFRVEINPDLDQKERFIFNNSGVYGFDVLGDKINPILDVTFDGMRIMDGDIVSPTPQIRIELKDENEFLLLDDITDFDLSLRQLPDNNASPIDLTSEQIIFTPADSSGNNEAVIEYFPELKDGEYILYVQATDASGNVSGDQDFEVRFRVIEDTRVSNVLNYPNPFSTSTQFIFTLTGHELPEVFTIQIMTVSGKVVREITREELGDLRIGLNRTSYRWDGTDEYGTRLANGVYLYRVLSSFEQNTQTHFENNAIDPFFKEGFGKLVIMR